MTCLQRTKQHWVTLAAAFAFLSLGAGAARAQQAGRIMD
jgi:hypothetical protein